MRNHKLNCIFKFLFDKNTRTRKIVIIISFILCYSNIKAQEKDTITKPIIENLNYQQFRINDNLTYQYSKPKFFDFITKVPHDFGLMGSMLIQKNNLIWLIF